MKGKRNGTNSHVAITEEILLKNGYEKDDFEMKNKKIEFFVSKDGHVVFRNDCMNTNNLWLIHVDNEAFETIGSCELTYVDEVNTFLKLCKCNDFIKHVED